jgi:hypothetical protein
MADIYSPWMASSEEDVTEKGFVLPEYGEMYAEAQGELESESDSASDSNEPATPAEAVTEGAGGMHESLKMALATINQQSTVINRLLAQLQGE